MGNNPRRAAGLATIRAIRATGGPAPATAQADVAEPGGIGTVVPTSGKGSRSPAVTDAERARFPFQPHNPALGNMPFTTNVQAPGPLGELTEHQQGAEFRAFERHGFNYQQARDTVGALIDQMKTQDPTGYELAKGWYSEAHLVAQGFHDEARTLAAEHHVAAPILEQVAGVIAALSPQNFWTAYVEGKQHTPSAQAKAEAIGHEAIKALVEESGNVNMVKSPNVDEAARIVLDYARNQPRTLTQDMIDKWSTLSPDERAEAHQWLGRHPVNDYPTRVLALFPQYASTSGRQGVKKAIDIIRLQQSTRESVQPGVVRARINEILGEGKKVRSFYNNIMHPEARGGPVTVDSHMLNAMLNGRDVVAAGGVSRRGEAPTVAEGTKGALDQFYNVAGQAIRDAASARGLTPDQAQAIAWVGWRRAVALDQPQVNDLFWNQWRQLEAEKAGRTAKVQSTLVP